MSYLPTIDPKLALQFMLFMTGVGIGTIIGLLIDITEGRLRERRASVSELLRLSRKMTDHAYEDAIKTGRQVAEIIS